MTPEITDPRFQKIAEEIAADPANASYTKRGVEPLFYAGPQCRIMIVGQACLLYTSPSPRDCS